MSSSLVLNHLIMIYPIWKLYSVSIDIIQSEMQIEVVSLQFHSVLK